MTLPELGGEALGEDRLVAFLAPPPLFARAEDDRLVGAVRAGDVDLVHTRVLDEIRTLLRAAIEHLEEAALDERAHPLFDERAEEDVHRVDLEGDHPVLDEELVEGVHRRDRRDVARAEHQATPPCRSLAR